MPTQDFKNFDRIYKSYNTSHHMLVKNAAVKHNKFPKKYAEVFPNLTLFQLHRLVAQPTSTRLARS